MPCVGDASLECGGTLAADLYDAGMLYLQKNILILGFANFPVSLPPGNQEVGGPEPLNPGFGFDK